MSELEMNGGVEDTGETAEMPPADAMPTVVGQATEPTFMTPAQDQQEAPTITAPEPDAPSEKRSRLSAWLQFPRRIVMLAAAYGMVRGIILLLRGFVLPVALDRTRFSAEDITRMLDNPDWTLSWVNAQPVAELAQDVLPNSLYLVIGALIVVLVLSFVVMAIGGLLHLLENQFNIMGFLVMGLGRFFTYPFAALPVFWLGLMLVYIFGVQLDLLPVAGIAAPGSEGPDFQHMILPMITLAMLPAILASQAGARVLTVTSDISLVRRLLACLFTWLGAVCGQVGGMLSALVLVETIFAIPGVGRRLFDSVVMNDIPLFFYLLGFFATAVLGGLLLEALFRWLARLVQPLPSTEPVPRTSWRTTSRKIRLIVSLLLLLIPIGFGVAGLMMDADAAIETNPQDSLQERSAEHPFGTDRLGRDIQTRVLRGASSDLLMAVLVTAAVFILAGIGGALTGWLTSYGTWWSELLADVLLLPADGWAMLPVIPAMMSLVLLLTESTTQTFVSIVAVVIAVRGVRFYHDLWATARQEKRWLTRLLPGLGALILGSLFAALSAGAALNFLGYGTPPPAPTLGGMIGENNQLLFQTAGPVIWPGVALLLCTMALYTAADALIGYFPTKEPFIHLNS